MREKIIAKASEDAEFRAKLVSDPKGTIGQELEVPIPEGLSVQVHEETANTVHLVLPPSSKLGEADLQTVAGGNMGDIGRIWRAQDW